jgi:hypothetical protein
VRANIDELGPEVIRALETIARIVGPLRPVHVSVDLATPGRAIVWVGRQRGDGELHALYVGELILPVVPEDPRPGVRSSSGIMPLTSGPISLSVGRESR